MHVTCYFDYTCRYSFRAFEWFQILESGNPQLEVRWATYLLKEANRPATVESVFESQILSLALLALALSHAARPVDFDRYHRDAFAAFHRDGERTTREELFELARTSGVDIDAFRADQHRWIGDVAREHEHGRSRWSVFGTPTLVLAEEGAVYLKLSSLPGSGDAASELWSALRTIAVTHPEVAEIKRPN